MSQEPNQRPIGGSTTTGSTCTKSGLYKATDGKIEMVVYIQANTQFPKFPGGDGSTNCTWTALSTSADGSRTGFTAVKVAAGTV
jgi:hypothetical protein